MFKRPLFLIAVLIITTLFFSLASAERGLAVIPIIDDRGNEVGLYKESHALIIGASEYTAGWPKLPGVKKDVEDVKSALEKHGFQVVVIMDPTRDRLVRAYEDFINQYGTHNENRLLFYFAGHGHTVKQSYGDEMGYLVPVDAPNPNKELKLFLAKALDMQLIEVFARRIQSKHALFIFDSCFSGSLFALNRGIPENISYKTAKPVRQFITSGAADEQVPDTSIFKQLFISAINGETNLGKNGYITGTSLGEFLQDSVVNYTKGAQHPQFGKIRNPNLDKGDFVFTLAKTTTGGVPEKFSGIQLKEAPNKDFSMEDFEKKAQQIEDNKAAWNVNLQRMKGAYDKVFAYQDRDVTPDLKADAWGSFLNSFKEKNPYTNEDGEMRKQARLEIGKWQTKIAPVEGQKQLAIATKSQATTNGITYREPLIGMEFVFVKGGCYKMGNVFGDARSDEKPVHECCLDDYFIGRFEVTQTQWGAIMGNNPAHFKNCGDNCPVEQISWNDAQLFITKLNNQAGTNKYRLPTEAEWEYAARSGGKREKYSGGDDADKVAWNTTNSGSKTHPVGTKGPNGLDLYDMSGNVWEWVQDSYGSNAYSNHSRSNPVYENADSSRVIRGGSWSSVPDGVRTTYRLNLSPSSNLSYLGFRLVMIP